MTERLVVVLCDLVKVVRTDVAKEERKIAEDIYGLCDCFFEEEPSVSRTHVRKAKNTCIIINI
jgi:hypothetical protein